mgnify:FL=1
MEREGNGTADILSYIEAERHSRLSKLDFRGGLERLLAPAGPTILPETSTKFCFLSWLQREVQGFLERTQPGRCPVEIDPRGPGEHLRPAMRPGSHECVLSCSVAPGCCLTGNLSCCSREYTVGVQFADGDLGRVLLSCCMPGEESPLFSLGCD